MEMGLQYLRVSLRGYGGETPTYAQFFALFGPETLPDGFRLLPSESAWEASLIEFFALDMKELAGFIEPSEEFASRTEQGFIRAAYWMGAVGLRELEMWRSEGRKADIFVRGWLANEQFDLQFPVVFLQECGRLGLPLSICTND